MTELGEATPSEVNTLSGDFSEEEISGAETDLGGDFTGEVRAVPSSTETMTYYQMKKGNGSDLASEIRLKMPETRRGDRK